MKIRLLSSFVFTLAILFQSHAQRTAVQAVSHPVAAYVPTMHFDSPDRSALRQEDEQRDRNGMLYRIGVAAFTDITTSNAGAWNTQQDGSRVWQLRIDFPGAEALSFLFDEFVIDAGTKVSVIDNRGKLLHPVVTAADMNEFQQQHIPLCFGDEMILEVREPAGAFASQIRLGRIMYNYRGTGNPNTEKDFGDSEGCEVNVNCSPAGDAWQDEKRGVARIYVVDGNLAGWCSGSLVNNLAQNCRPYFLTAQHCGVDVTAADLNQWVFNFAYEAPGCSDPNTESGLDVTAKRITGCFMISNSQGVSQNNITSSDFILLQLGTSGTEQAVIAKLKTSAINAYWNGWDANNVAASNGAGIHHPAGDIKKISTYTGTLVSTTYSGTPNTHWRVVWTANSNGHGVTEGGSSGSPIFNNNGGNSRIVGTLSGGTSFCDELSSPDLYGKMSYHWTSNGTSANRQLKPWLDPANTGVLVCNGSSNPCAAGAAPVAQFIGTPVTVNVGGTVAFTDQSTNNPTAWSWSISPSTGWTFVNGTSASSQNPQVTFTVQGTYTVTLTASNSYGSDSEVKQNYITVTIVSAPCTATSATCDEYISNVSLEGIDNSTNCTNYQAYPLQTALLQQGAQYTLTVTPGTDGGPETAYPGDEIAAWIDWNHDYDFTDEGEQIAYVQVATNWSNQFNFTVPMGSATGALPMRVRISYQPEDGDIQPCGMSVYGEVEDYIVTVTSAPAGLKENDGLSLVAVYPNPAVSVIYADLTHITGSVALELTDITGKTLRTINAGAGTLAEVPLDGIAKGSYQLRLFSEGAMTVRTIIVK
jgi:lysyl endopeptidase